MLPLSTTRNLFAICCLSSVVGISSCQIPSSLGGGEKKDPTPVKVADRTHQLNLEDHGNRRYTITLKDVDHLFTKQRTEVLCWAACSSMIHGINGKKISQEEILAIVQGVTVESGKEQSASFFEVVKALTPDLEDRSLSQAISGEFDSAISDINTGKAVTKADVRTGPAIRALLDENFLANRNPAIDDLKLGHPAFVALKGPPSDEDEGHAYVMVGATFKEPSEQLVNLLDKLKTTQGLLKELPFGPAAKLNSKIEKMQTWHSQYDSARNSPEAEMAFDQMGYDRYDTETVILMDPWQEDAAAARIEMSGPEFIGRVSYVITASDARAIVNKWKDSITVESKQIIPDPTTGQNAEKQ